MLAGHAALVTALAVSAALVVGHKWLKIPLSVMMGVASGLHTQPAALAFATERSKLDGPSVGYATVYPMATVLKILLAQVLLMI